MQTLNSISNGLEKKVSHHFDSKPPGFQFFQKWSRSKTIHSHSHSFGPHGAENIKLNVIGFCWWVAHRAVPATIRGRFTAAVTLPTNPVSTKCYCDKSNLNKICSLPEGRQALLTLHTSLEVEFIKAMLPAQWSCIYSSCFPTEEYHTTSANTRKMMLIFY